MKKILLLSLLQGATLLGFAQTGFSLVEKADQKRVDVLLNSKLLTSYCYPDSVMKPFLWPINTLEGITVTRGYPLDPKPGERTDHPHHVGLWLNYESVNGLDFWNNSTAIAYDQRHKYGTIVHDQVVAKEGGKDRASIVSTANWIRPDGKALLKERTTHTFRIQNGQLLIDRKTTLTANDIPVDFKDVKDGFFAIRVSRELELPSQQADVFVDANGNKTEVPRINNEGVTGNYLTSEGVTGDDAWSTRGRWTLLTGKKGGRDVSIGIIDHPYNLGYPAYRHARGYGLFAINPLGQKVFSNGKEELNYSLKPGQSVTFFYRVLVASNKAVTAADMNKLADAFAKEK